MLTQQIRADLAKSESGVNIREFGVKEEPGSHRDAIYSALRQLYHVKHNDLFVVSLLRTANPDEYRRIVDVCSGTKPAIENFQIVTAVGEFHDAGLLMRNLSRKVASIASVPGEGQQQPQPAQQR